MGASEPSTSSRSSSHFGQQGTGHTVADLQASVCECVCVILWVVHTVADLQASVCVCVILWVSASSCAIHVCEPVCAFVCVCVRMCTRVHVCVCVPSNY
jgi:hypothetical protein